MTVIPHISSDPRAIAQMEVARDLDEAGRLGFFFFNSASCRAFTALIAAAVTSRRIPSSSSQLSKLDPMCGFFLAMTVSYKIASMPLRLITLRSASAAPVGCFVPRSSCEI